jgi:adenylate kinase
MGPPGSGKGTQAKRISKKLGIPHISTGDLFRENLGNGTPLGLKVKGYLESGNLVPDEIVVDMLINRVSADDCQEGYLLDGFPRSTPQAEALEKQLGSDIDLVVINLQVPDDLVFKRIEGRRTCKDCGTIYNKYFTPSKNSDKCDHCNGDLNQRSDDKAEVIEERLKVYHSQTAPVEKFYLAQGVIKNVDGVQDPDAVFDDVIKILALHKVK